MTRPLSRARASQVDAIVADIADAMVDGTWRAGKSHRELAEREGVSVERVEDWATEAGRHLRLLQLRDPADLRARNQARLDRVYEMALEKQAVVTYRDRDPEVVPQPDLKAAVSALAEQGKLLGLNAPERTEATVRVSQAPQDAPTELAEVEEAIRALEARRDELRAAMATQVTVVEET